MKTWLDIKDTISANPRVLDKVEAAQREDCKCW